MSDPDNWLFQWFVWIKLVINLKMKSEYALVLLNEQKSVY